MPAVVMGARTAGTEKAESPNESHSPANSTDSGGKKRNTTSAALDANGNPKPVKRRAAKACAACRSRKVRCDVMQRYHITSDGSVTCSNCTMDGIKCVIEESKRRKKHINGQTTTPTAPPQAPAMNGAQVWSHGFVNLTDISNSGERRWSDSSAISNEVPGGQDLAGGHVPHSIYQNVSQQLDNRDILRRQSYIVPTTSFEDTTNFLLTTASIHGDRKATRLDTPVPPAPMLKHALPEYLKPLPQRMTSVDIDYLFAKGALSLPDVNIRNALLESYVEYVHPYMPLIELHEVLQIIQDGNGANGRISLLLFQAIMFAGTAFVDMDYLKAAGFSNRKAARKAFFQKARVLYDFDYEIDRVSLVQSLLLMTYWYETPDDQKDTWHWMGVAISLAHTIGLHRNPEHSNMEPSRKKLWKRIWWSCFMRDRLVALGMRRPTRVKDEDYDVPMLTEDDFETKPLSDNITIVASELIRNGESQRQLAQLCIAKAKLCLCVSHVLSAQYSVLIRNQGMQEREGSTRSSVMLFPKKLDQTDEVKRCDVELSQWIAELPGACQYSNELAPGPSGSPLFTQRALLHMVYFTTLSALHRPQVLPSASTSHPDSSRELQDLSRKKVREASREITRISRDLQYLGLERYLPTTGVTVLLPAIIIHLLDIKSCNDEARATAMDGFIHCMAVLEKLRDSYASADFATQFLDAAIRKAEIDIVVPKDVQERQMQFNLSRPRQGQRTPPHEEKGLRLRPDFQDSSEIMDMGVPAGHASVANAIAARTPPEGDDMTDTTYLPLSTSTERNGNGNVGNLSSLEFGADVDLNVFLNFDEGNEMWNVSLEEGAHGESGGFMGDMTWIDQAPGWSRLNSPVPGDAGDIFGKMEVD